MLRRPLSLIVVVLSLSLSLVLVATGDAAADCPGSCYPDTVSGISWYGGTAWDATDARWEALPGGTWTFDSGVGSNILADSLNNKVAGLHGIMEGWTGVLAGGVHDWSNIAGVTDLAAPLTSCTCALGDSVLLFEDLDAYGHQLVAGVHRGRFPVCIRPVRGDALERRGVPCRARRRKLLHPVRQLHGGVEPYSGFRQRTLRGVRCRLAGLRQ